MRCHGHQSAAGTVTSGGVLTADTSAITDANDSGFAYQWQVNTGTHATPTWTGISGATASSYTVGATDAVLGKEVRVQASYTDSSGAAHVLPSTPVNTPVAGSAWLNGSFTSGSALSLDTSAISDANGLGAFHVQWQRQDYHQTYTWSIPWTNPAVSHSGTFSSSQHFDSSGQVVTDGPYTDLYTAEVALFNQMVQRSSQGNWAPVSYVVNSGSNLDVTTVHGVHVQQDGDNLKFWQVQLDGTQALAYTIPYLSIYASWDSYTNDLYVPQGSTADAELAPLLSLLGQMITATDTAGTAHWTDLSNTSATAYTLTDADLGRLVQAKVTYTDAAGHAESFSSVANHAPTVASVGAIGFTGFTRQTGGTVTYNTLQSNTGAADADSDPLTFLITQVQSGTLTKMANGSNTFEPVTEGTTTVASGDTLQWVPASDAVAGTDTYAFVVKAFDGHLYSEPVSVHTVL